MVYTHQPIILRTTIGIIVSGESGAGNIRTMLMLTLPVTGIPPVHQKGRFRVRVLVFRPLVHQKCRFRVRGALQELGGYLGEF